MHTGDEDTLGTHQGLPNRELAHMVTEGTRKHHSMPHCLMELSWKEN